MERSRLLDDAVIRPGEIDYPEYADLGLLRAMAHIRQATQAPIIYTSSGEMWNGEAHSRFSLHKIGVDHVKSYRRGYVHLDSRIGYKAFDIVCPDIDIRDFYFTVSRFITGGIGVYPYWNRPGLHVDVRPEHHKTYGARWWRGSMGTYLRISNSNDLRAVLEIAHMRGGGDD